MGDHHRHTLPPHHHNVLVQEQYYLSFIFLYSLSFGCRLVSLPGAIFLLLPTVVLVIIQSR